jgi:hypothetical protein
LAKSGLIVFHPQFREGFSKVWQSGLWKDQLKRAEGDANNIENA